MKGALRDTLGAELGGVLEVRGQGRWGASKTIADRAVDKREEMGVSSQYCWHLPRFSFSLSSHPLSRLPLEMQRAQLLQANGARPRPPNLR